MKFALGTMLLAALSGCTDYSLLGPNRHDNSIEFNKDEENYFVPLIAQNGGQNINCATRIGFTNEIQMISVCYFVTNDNHMFLVVAEKQHEIRAGVSRQAKLQPAAINNGNALMEIFDSIHTKVFSTTCIDYDQCMDSFVDAYPSLVN